MIKSFRSCGKVYVQEVPCFPFQYLNDIVKLNSIDFNALKIIVVW